MTVVGEIKRDTTLVDEYIRQLSDLGISLKSLGILAETDLSDEDKKLTEKELIEKILEDSNYKDKKENIEKYITEFVKADLITQQIHRRRGAELTNYLNGHDDWVDGGVYLYRTKQSGLISTELNTDSDEEVKVVNSTEYVQMQYVTPEEFQELVDKKSKKLRYRYTIDEDTGELKYAQIKTIETIKTDMNYKINTLFPADTTEIEVEKIISMDYKAYINKYTMPYEFLINLCQITQNPEFVYHVAQLARETTIMLAIQDDTTQEHVTLIEEEFYKTYENNDSDSTSDAKLTSERTDKTKTEIITTTMVPNLQVEFANTWSFFENFEYSKKIDTETTTNGPLTTVYSLPSTLPNHQEGGTYKEIGAEGVEQEVTKPEKWYGEFLVQKTTTTTTEITTTTYTPAVLKNSVEKSKQFLGLVRSSTGKCKHKGKCFDDVQKAKECAQKAEFDKKGINVTYKLPDRTIEEEVYGKLKSGEKMLYSLMGEGTQVSANIKNEEDATSEYVGRMSGLVDHIKYLMTFPENEDITDLIKGLIDEITGEITGETPDYTLSDDEYSQLNVDDLIVKTDEPNALRAVSKDELIAVISSSFSGNERTNALSLVDTLIDCQNKYKVNAIFILAVAHQESSIGTANTSHVKNNNWLSWSLGTNYASPQDNVKIVMGNIATGLNYFTQGKITIKDIGYTFCPNTTDYPTQGDGWVLGVTSWVKKMYSALGKNIDSTGANTDVTTDTYTVDGKTYSNYKQDSGSSWSNNTYAGGTMKDSGCSITAIAIVLTGYGNNVTPETIRQDANGKLADLSGLLQKYGVSCSRPDRILTKDEIVTHLQSGKPIIANVQGEWTSSSGHYMVLLDYRNNNGVEQVYVSNPGTVNSTKNGWVNISRITNNLKTRSILVH